MMYVIFLLHFRLSTALRPLSFFGLRFDFDLFIFL
jgi:hypothetical protein